MKIWIFNNYNMLPEQGGLNRHYYFGKGLKEFGHEPVVFVGSHPHNTDLQLIEGKEAFRVYQEEPFPWVLVKTCNYEGSKLKRVWSMIEYYRNAKKAAASFEKPDAIIGSSAHPLAAVLAIRLGKKCGCRAIVEVRDLWPESILVYGVAGPRNPAIIALRRLEKWIYKKADALVFTMEGAYDYIVEQGWEKEVPREKVHYINNGIDVATFDYNKKHFQIEDRDLDNPDILKVVYTGSIRKANESVGALPEVAKRLQERGRNDIVILVYGSGEREEDLRRECKENGIGNLILKGKVDKAYIPYVLSRADILVLNFITNEVMRFGGSQNKLFEYLASGKPIISGQDDKYSIVRTENCGISQRFNTTDDIVDAILELKNSAISSQHIREVGQKYDFKELTAKLIDVIEEC